MLQPEVIFQWGRSFLFRQANALCRWQQRERQAASASLPLSNFPPLTPSAPGLWCSVVQSEIAGVSRSSCSFDLASPRFYPTCSPPPDLWISQHSNNLFCRTPYKQLNTENSRIAGEGTFKWTRWHNSTGLFFPSEDNEYRKFSLFYQAACLVISAVSDGTFVSDGIHQVLSPQALSRSPVTNESGGWLDASLQVHGDFKCGWCISAN